MKRRTFLKHTAHTVALPALLGPFGNRLFAQTLNAGLNGENKILVIIYLQGGNDGLNTVIPLDQLSALNKVRPHVILPENKLLKLSGANVALHPQLKGLQSLFAEDRLKIIQSVGYPEQNYSHFRSTDIWMSGSDADQLVTSGWTGRFLNSQYPGFPENYPNENNTDPLSIEIGYGSTMMFQGPEAAMSMVLNDPTDFYGLVENSEGELPNTIAGDKLRHIRLTARQSQLYGEVVKQAAQKINNQKPYPETDLAQQLKIVSRLIAGGLKTPLYLVRIDGFDTHDNQVEAGDHSKGEHSELLKNVDEAILAFMNDLEFLGVDDSVTGMTFSEFGRRIVSNASMGTDHGAAAPMFVFGNHVVPGVFGENPSISESASYKDNLPFQTDFREVYASILEQWFNIGKTERNNILLKDFNRIPVIKTEPLVSANENLLPSQFKVYPNPVQKMATVQFFSTGKTVNIYVIDLTGKIVSTVFSGKTKPGIQNISWNTGNIPNGNYHVIFSDENFRKSFPIIKAR